MTDFCGDIGVSNNYTNPSDYIDEPAAQTTVKTAPVEVAVSESINETSDDYLTYGTNSSTNYNPENFSVSQNTSEQPETVVASFNGFDQASLLKSKINSVAESLANTLGANKLNALSATNNADTPRQLTNGESVTLYPEGGGTSTPIIYINGINMSSTEAQQEGQMLANITNRPVEVIYQQTNLGEKGIQGAIWGGGTTAGGTAVGTLAGAGIGTAIAPGPGTIAGGIIGFVGGFFATSTTLAPIEVKALLKNEAAGKTEASKILNQLGNPTSNDQVQVVAYSQGATITAQTLNNVKDQLKNQYGEDAANKMMSRINVLSLGGAANIGDFPKGVNVVSTFRQKDLVSQYLGDNSNGTDGAEFDLKPHFYYLSHPNISNDIIPRWLKGELKNAKIQPLSNESTPYPNVQIRYNPISK